jgi:PhnB protein
MTSEPTPGYRVEKDVEVAAPVEAVWRALTTPEGLRSFYCDDATVVPGEGGSVQVGWTAGALPAARIDAWEPGRRLRLVHGEGDGVTTAEEWTLRPDGDVTAVRLVFEGFGPGDDWDEQYDRFSSTTALLLDLLATYLGPGRGGPLAKAEVDVPVAGDLDAAWGRALGPAFTDPATGRALSLPAGTDVDVALPGGPPLAATVVHAAAGDELLVALGETTRMTVVVRPGRTPGSSRLLISNYAWDAADGTRATAQARLDAAADAVRSDSPPEEEHAMTDRSYIPDGSHAVTPYICCADAAAAIDFYVDVFGAREVGSRFVDAEGRVGHAELVIGDSMIYLSDPFPAIGVVAPNPEGASVGLLVYVPDVDAVVAKAEAGGARVASAVEETFYGTRRGTLVDPFGHRWLVGTHVRNVSEEEYQAAVEGFAETPSTG